MAARPTWRGIIKLALVSIPVEIYPATKSGKSIAFHQVHEPSGKRVRYEKVVPGIGPVDRDEILKGYEVSKGEYVLLEPEEIESVKLDSRKTLDLSQFVELSDIDGKSSGEIGEMLDLPRGTVRWHLHQARKTLRVALATLLEKSA